MKDISCLPDMLDCPYYKAGQCTMLEEECIHPQEGCDDYYTYIVDEG